MKDKLIEIKKVMNQLNELVYDFNAKHHGEKIIFADDFEVDKDGYNFKIVSVNPEENSVELEYDVFEEDNQIKCTEYIYIEQFLKYVK